MLHSNFYSRVGIEYKSLWQTLVDMIFPFEFSLFFSGGQIKPKWTVLANIKILSDLIFFLDLQRTHDKIDIYRFPRKVIFSKISNNWNFEKNWNQPKDSYRISLNKVRGH
jgi:hypothetical protein